MAFLIFCVHLDPSDDEWEEESSSDESDMGPDGLCDGGSSFMSPLCLSAEIHGALINHNIPEKAKRLVSFHHIGSLMQFYSVTLSLTANPNLMQTRLTPLFAAVYRDFLSLNVFVFKSGHPKNKFPQKGGHRRVSPESLLEKSD